ncbi:MAG: type II/IV secretion system protein [Elusimicrobia bacterium]|nr:type II/IV secretion system protein [Elusimicrobiota bacterium]
MKTAHAWNVAPLPPSGATPAFAAAAADPELAHNLRVLLNRDVGLEVRPAAEVDELRRSIYGLGASALADTGDAPPPEASAPAADSPAARFIQSVIVQACAERATDIHFEPFEDAVVLRFRVDGLLREISTPTSLAAHYPSVVSRLKILARLNIAQKRLPQDGHFQVDGGDALDLRLSTVPTVHGESVDIRILPRGRGALALESLGLDPETRADLFRLISRPGGILLVTGPTGHGKTTTLYACLSRLNTPERKIVTIEDPVEVRLRGVNQIQVHPRIGLTFEAGLRSVLRQDPDVLMVGEIRDADTAGIAIRSALTGHLVFSTLHTIDAVGAIARLLEMGIEPYLLAASVNAVLAQRLVRVVCAACSGGGCLACRETGFFGRTGLFELLVLDDELRSLIVERANAREIRRRAREKGLRSLFDDGRQKAADGVTTLAEVSRVVEDAA